MPDNPELVNVIDLEKWADRLEARAVLPHLIRRLLHSTPGVTGISVRADEGIGLGGWDGRANGGTGTAYVPAGMTRWEMGTGNDPRSKGDSDYRKRTEAPQGVEPASTAFVFVTLRRWAGKDAWMRKKQNEGIWREVVALDADDLEGWLEATPGVHIWLSELMGRNPLDVRTLDRWWRWWSTQTRPTLPAGLLLAGRQDQVKELRGMLVRPAEAVGIRTNSRDEAIAFVAASLMVDEAADDPLATVLIVSGRQAWTRLTSSSSPAIFIPDFEGADVVAAKAGGHHVLVPMGRGDAGPDRVLLPRLARDEARDALQAAGWSREDAERHSAQARRSLASLRRQLAVNPQVAKPRWATRPAAGSLAPLVLVGSWSTDSDADWMIVTEVAGLARDQLERDLAEWANSDDPPFRLSGRTWRLTAPLDAWALLRPILTRNDLARWRDAALRVLSEPDPAFGLPVAERPFAAIRGARRTWSDQLRHGLAYGAVILGTTGEVLADRMTGEDHAALLVSKLLDRANSDLTGRLWKSLEDVLPLLAEAAPEEFLDAAEAVLSGYRPLFRSMFTDSEHDALVAAFSPHTGLLWALEVLAWSGQYFSRAVDVLAHLAELDPGGRQANRPSESLRNILVAWSPQTSAPLEQRLSAMERLLTRRPAVGWPLLLKLLPTMHDIAIPTAAPSLRDWKPDNYELTWPEIARAKRRLVDLAIRAVGEQPTRWVDLLDGLSGFPVEGLDRAIATLERISAESLGSDDRLALWEAVVKLVANHRQFATAEWARDEESLARLAAFAERIEPRNAPERHARLFDWSPDMPGADKLDRRVYDGLVADARRSCVQEALKEHGPEALFLLAAKSSLPWLVGAVAADVAGERLIDELLPWLAAKDARRDVAIGCVRRMAEVRGWDWIDGVVARVATLSEGARSLFFLSLPNEPRTWTLAAQEVGPVQDQYWRSVQAMGMGLDNAIPFAERLLDHRRPWSAIDVLALVCPSKGATALNPDLVARALRVALDQNAEETYQPGAFEHDVGSLLDYLEETGASSDLMEELEWGYFAVLDHVRPPRALHARLAATPNLFVEAVCARFRGEREPASDVEADASASSRARNCFLLLRGWRLPPGTANDGSINQTVLRAWIDEARRMFAESDRAEIGDVYIGELLSGSPVGQDGVWPAEPIRDIIEGLASPKLGKGLSIGKRNSRGVTMRGVYDGGKQELSLSDQFRSWAEQVEDRWPRTGRILREIADDYARQAGWHDMEADELADEG